MPRINKNNIKNSILLILLCGIFISFYGCFSYSVRAESIAIDEETVPTEATISDFDITKIKLLVTRVDGTVDSLNITKEMVSNESLKKLEKSGVHNIYIRYDGKLAIFTIKLVEEYSNVTVTFETNGGNIISSQSIEKNTKAFRPVNPTKKGYVFSGWYLDKSLTEEFLFSSEVDKDITLYAKWVESINTITYFTNCDIEISPSEVKTGEKLFEIIPNRDGYAFSGWYLDNDFITKYDYNTIVDDSFALYAKWEANKHRVNFKCNGGSLISAITIAHDEKLENNFVTTKKGHDFEGWYLDSDLTIRYDFDSLVTENFTLYAKWVKALMKVTFDTNGGSSVDAKYVEFGSSFKFDFQTTRSNSVFLGWYLEPEFINEFFETDEVYDNITLYAKWQSGNISITFESNGGNSVPKQTIKSGDKVALPENPKKIGYIFVSWCTSKDLSEEFDFKKAVYESTTIYAKWILDTSIKNKYSVVILDETNEILDSFKVEEGSTLEEIVPVDVDFKMFAGWYSDSAMIFSYDLSKKIYSNISIYAKYIDAYTIEFRDINDEVLLIQKVGEGNDAIPPTAPEIKGYAFSHWDKDLTNVHSNFVTKPVYTTYKYDVKFIIDGKVVSTQKVSNGSVPEEPTKIEKYIKEGYHFSKWNTEIGKIYQDTVYTAIIEKNIYKVDFIDYYGNVYYSINVMHGDLLKTPNDDINEFYVCSSWYSDKTLKKAFDFTKAIYENTCVYGDYDFSNRISYTIENGNIIIKNINLLNLEEVNIPNNLNEKIVVSVLNLSNYEKVKKINVSNNITSLNIENLLEIQLLEEINVDNNNKNYATEDGVLYDKELKTLLAYPKAKNIDTFKVPNNVTKISDYAFSNSLYLSKVDLNNVTTLGKEIIANSSVLCLIINKDSISKDSDTFKNCNTSLKIVIDKNYYLNYQRNWSDVINMLYSKEYVYNNFLYHIVDNKVEIVEYLGNENYLEVPSKIGSMLVNKINSYAFNSNFDIKGITLPYTITSLEDNAFNNLKLEYLKINSVISISNDYMKDLKESLSDTNVYVLDNVYDSYKEKLSRCYKISQIIDDYAYVEVDGEWGILQYFGEDNSIVLPEKYNKNSISFIDKDFILGYNVSFVTIKGKVEIKTDAIEKRVIFLVDDDYLNEYLEKDYAFYSNKIKINNDTKYLYGEVDGKVILMKIMTETNSIIIPDYINNKKVEVIGRYALISNNTLEQIEVGENILEIRSNALKLKDENKLKIIFKCDIAPSIENEVCYDSDEIYKISFEQKEYGIRFNNHTISVLNSNVRENENYKYFVLDKKASIIQYLGYSSEVVIPSVIDECEVVSIESRAFSGKTTVNKVLIPSCVKTIGYLAFDDMKNLEEIIIESDDVVYIEEEIIRKPIVIRVNDSLLFRYRNSENWAKQEVFSKSSEVIDDERYQYVVEDGEAIIIKCKKYSYSLTISNSSESFKIKKLGAYSFYNTDIKKITLYEQLDCIGYNALPLSLESIVLYYSTPFELKEQEANFSVNISDDYYDMFIREDMWNKYHITSTYDSNKKNANYEYYINNEGAVITKYIGTETSIAIPSTIDGYYVVGIGPNAFRNTNITSVIFCDTIKKVYEYAFYDCEKLSFVVCSSKIDYIGEKAFDNTEWIKTKNESYTIIGKVLYRYNDINQLNAEVIITEEIISIAPYAFLKAENITKVVLPKTLEKIGKGAFKDCSNLSSITIPSKVKRIDDETFANCIRLKEVKFDNSLTEIGRNAFANCEKLEKFDFGKVEVIEDYAFVGCKKLDNVKLPSTIKKLGHNIFENCEKLSEISIENGAEYKIENGILYDRNLNVLYEDLLRLKERNIEVLSTVSLIKENAFSGSKVLKVIISSLVTIEKNAFGNNEKLSAIVFTSTNIPVITENSFEEGTEIYFANKIVDKIKSDYLYQKYLVYPLFAYTQKEYTIKLGKEVKLVPICPLYYEEDNISYLYSDEGVISIENGKVTAKAVGSVHLSITLKLNDSYNCIIVINVEK